jgi:hypothetical protein
VVEIDDRHIAIAIDMSIDGRSTVSFSMKSSMKSFIAIYVELDMLYYSMFDQFIAILHLLYLLYSSYSYELVDSAVIQHVDVDVGES